MQSIRCETCEQLFDAFLHAVRHHLQFIRDKRLARDSGDVSALKMARSRTRAAAEVRAEAYRALLEHGILVHSAQQARQAGT